MALTSFEFFDIHEKGANSAVVSYQKEVKRLIGEYNADNMLKRFCYYKRGEGTSMVENFKYVPATAYTRDNKMIDLAKFESDFIRNGRKDADRATYNALITQVKTQRGRMQVYPKTAIVESEPINRREALALGGNDAEAGFAMKVAEDGFVRPMIASETHENNTTFIAALQDVVTNGFKFKKTAADGSVRDGDGEDITVTFPEFCKYATAAAYLQPSDLIKIRAQAQNNMTDAPELQRQMTIVMSPNTAAEMLVNNNKDSDILHKAMFENKGTGDTSIPTAYGFAFYVHPLVPDNECFVITPGVTMGVYDWGTITQSQGNDTVWTVNTIRRSPSYGVKVTQPLSMIHITITGKTAAYDNDRLAALETTTDEFMKPIRKKAAASS